MAKWFSETLHSTVRQALRVKKVLYSGKSLFQKMLVLDTESFGRALILDGVVQTTEKDEFIYHEMMAHVPLFSHPNPKRVLIIGGGDGGILREVLKHPVEEAYLVEIDEQVITLCKKYLKTICRNAFTDPRTRVVVEDGAKFIVSQRQPFDVVIIDSTDPIGPAKVLFSKKFYQDVKQLLCPSGILVRQTGSTFLQANEWIQNYRQVKSFFDQAHPFVVAIPTYIGGFFSLLFASSGIDPGALDRVGLAARFGELGLATRYYNPEIHESSFQLPENMRSRIQNLSVSRPIGGYKGGKWPENLVSN